MSFPTAFFLDTSVLAGQHYNFESTALSTFIPLAKKHSLKLLLPSPTESEIVRHIKERSDEALKALEDARRKAPFLAKWKHFPPKTTGYGAGWEVMRVATAEWEAFLKRFSFEKLDYGSVNLAEVMRWYDQITPPFREGKKRKEFPDAFAIAIVESYARRTGESVAIVSEDLDIKLACDRFSSLMYFRSLPALTELLLSDETKLDLIREQILKDMGAVEEAALEAAGDMGYYHSDPKYKIVRTKTHGVDFNDIHIVSFGAGECTLTFRGKLEAEHLLRWREWDSDYDDYIDEERWVIETASVSGTAKVTLDSKVGGISEVVFFQLDASEIEVTENPWNRW